MSNKRLNRLIKEVVQEVFHQMNFASTKEVPSVIFYKQVMVNGRVVIAIYNLDSREIWVSRCRIDDLSRKKDVNPDILICLYVAHEVVHWVQHRRNAGIDDVKEFEAGHPLELEADSIAENTIGAMFDTKVRIINEGGRRR